MFYQIQFLSEFIDFILVFSHQKIIKRKKTEIFGLTKENELNVVDSLHLTEIKIILKFNCFSVKIHNLYE